MDQAWLDELSEFLRIPSVSADPLHDGHVREAGEWVRDFVRRSGGEAELQETDAQPLVVGEFPASSGAADAATVLVLPSRSENFGNVILESWAAGRPVAVTPEVGLAATVRETGAGIVADGDLGTALRELLADPARLDRMGRSGEESVRERFQSIAAVAMRGGKGGRFRCEPSVRVGAGANHGETGDPQSRRAHGY